VVDVRDDAEISNELRVHFSRLPIFSIAGRMRTVRTIFRGPADFERATHAAQKTVPYEQLVCHNSKAASAGALIHAKRKSALLSCRSCYALTGGCLVRKMKRTETRKLPE
jgi:hypothetical protein